MLKTFVRHLLLFGVIFGLAGQGVARASAPCAPMAQAQGGSMADMPDCMAGKGKVPCKEMTPGCLAMAGCAAAVVLEEPPFLIGAPVALYFAASWPMTPVLTGRDIAPDPDPPSLLG